MIESTLNDQDIISSYLGGKGIIRISKEHGCSPEQIKDVLDFNGIPRMTSAKRHNPTFKEDYFEQIDSKEKAYWLGLLLTDGSVDKAISISLIGGDKDTLDLLESDLGLVDHVKPFNERYQRFAICSTKMTSDLKQYGMIQNRKMTLKFPDNIPEEYEIHFLRGLFDGDGGFTLGTASHYFRQRGKAYVQPYCELSFTGTYDMCENFQRVILKYLDIPIKNIGTNHSIYRVRWGSVPVVLQICGLLYADAGSHCLTRKYNLYQQLLEQSRVSA